MSHIRYCITNEDERKCYYITDESDEMKSINLNEKMKDKTNHYYDVFSKLYNEEIGIEQMLLNFKNDFTIWSDEIKNLYDLSNYDYLDPKEYYYNNSMVYALFIKYTKKTLEKYKFDDIDPIETQYIERCNNR